MKHSKIITSKISVFTWMLFSILVIAGCKSEKTPEQMLCKTWRMKSFSMGDKMVPPQVLMNSRFQYFEDGRYEIMMGEPDVGKWEISKNGKVLISHSTTEKTTKEIDIQVLTDSLLILTNFSEGSRVKIELVPEE